jgi:hypothetical protein
MTPDPLPRRRPRTIAHAALLFPAEGPLADPELAKLRSDPDLQVIDHRSLLGRELEQLQPPLGERDLAEPIQWAYYPWRHALVSVLGPRAFRRLRLDRNRNKITFAEQDQLGRLRIGIVGLSVGHAIAHTLAMEGLCGLLRLADNDSIELSNLNRIPATILDLGINKAVVVARRIAELDPYLQVETLTAGISEDSMAAFFDGLDLVIEECDSLDMKVRVRQEAKTRGIPVLMETSDRGLFDVERFDQEPDRQLFHGLLGDTDPALLRGLSNRDKAPHVMRILQTQDLSARMAASMVEIDRTVSSWPQLGSDVQLGGATVAAAVRRFGLGDELRSGRIRIDLNAKLDQLGAAFAESAIPADVESRPTGLTDQLPLGPTEALVHAIRLAPSGGNSQPWSIDVWPGGVDIMLAPERTSAMDVQFRGSYVAIGAAAFNSRVAAARHSMLGSMAEFPAGPASATVVSLALGHGTDPELAELYPAMIQRISNRNFGHRAALPAGLTRDLCRDAQAEGGRLRLITDPVRLALLADLLASSDRIRYLTPQLHREMMSEIKWPSRDRLDLGIDVRTLGLDDTDIAKLEVAGRPDVMAQLASWDLGEALGDNTRDRVNASSAVAVLTVPGQTPVDYMRGGMAVERVWIRANQHDLAVQPISPVFMYARTERELDGLSGDFSAELHSLQCQFDQLLELEPSEVVALVLRLSNDAPPAIRSQRLRLEHVMSGRPRHWTDPSAAAALAR